MVFSLFTFDGMQNSLLELLFDKYLIIYDGTILAYY